MKSGCQLGGSPETGAKKSILDFSGFESRENASIVMKENMKRVLQKVNGNMQDLMMAKANVKIAVNDQKAVYGCVKAAKKENPRWNLLNG